MKLTRETTLEQALETIRLLVDQLQNSTVAIEDREVGRGDAVHLEIEVESSGDAFELEVEIKWRAPQERSTET